MLTAGRGRRFNFLALDKPTYQILASYWAEEPQKSSCVGGGGGGGGWYLDFSVQLRKFLD